MQYPDGLRYTKEHEWVRAEGDVGVVGVTHHAQEALGDVVFVDLPAKGTKVTQGRPFGTVESVKAVSELFAPVSGEVVAVNDTLAASPETVNGDPHGSGWMVKIRLADPAELSALLDAKAYAALL
jgi:glycine cleavage system H protein